MKTIERKDLNLYIEKEIVDGRRFEYLVRAYKVVDDEIVAFLGKYFVPTNYTDDEIVELFHDPWTESEETDMENNTTDTILGEKYDERFGLEEYDPYDPFEE